MAKKSSNEETIVDVQEMYSKSEMLIDKYRNVIFGVLGGVALLVAGYYAYNKLYKLPREEKASAEMWMAEIYFNEDKFDEALAGDDTYAGLEEIAETYGNTNAGKRAHYMIAIIHRDKGTPEDYQIALDHFLIASELNDQAIGPLAAGNAGDMYLELGDLDKGLALLEEAANRADNIFISTVYLMKAAQICMLEGRSEEAKAHLSRIIKDYPESTQFKEAEKYLAAIEG